MKRIACGGGAYTSADVDNTPTQNDDIPTLTKENLQNFGSASGTQYFAMNSGESRSASYTPRGSRTPNSRTPPVTPRPSSAVPPIKRVVKDPNKFKSTRPSKGGSRSPRRNPCRPGESADDALNRMLREQKQSRLRAASSMSGHSSSQRSARPRGPPFSNVGSDHPMSSTSTPRDHNGASSSSRKRSASDVTAVAESLNLSLIHI